MSNKKNDNIQITVAGTRGLRLEELEKIDLESLGKKEKVVEEIYGVKNDIHLNVDDFSTIKNLISPKDLKELLEKSQVYSVNRARKIKLIDLGDVGIGIKSDSETTIEKEKYALINGFIKGINHIIKESVKREDFEKTSWLKASKKVQEILEASNRKNNAKTAKLHKIRRELANFSRIAGKLKNKFNIRASKKCIDFIINDLHLDPKMIFDFLDDKDAFVIERTADFTLYKIRNAESVSVAFEYIFKFFNLFLTALLEVAKQKRAKRITDIFAIDLGEIKAHAFLKLNEFDYFEVFQKNINKLFEYFIETITGEAEVIVNKNLRAKIIKERVFTSALLFVGSMLSALLTLILIEYRYTLIKNYLERQIVFALVALLFLCFLVAAFTILRRIVKPKNVATKAPIAKFSISAAAILLIFFSLAFTASMVYTNRYDGYDGTYYYSHLNEKQIEIRGVKNKTQAHFEIPNEINGHVVYTLNASTFRGNKRVKSVDFSNSNVTIRKEKSFQNCSNLQEIKLSSRQITMPSYTFNNCYNLQNVEGGALQSIGIKAFSNCQKMRSFDLQEVKTIERQAFKNCQSLGTVEFNDNLKIISKEAFQSCVYLYFDKLPEKIQAIEKRAFKNCYSIEVIALHASVQSVGEKAFDNCLRVRRIDIPDMKIFEGQKLTYFFGRQTLNGVKTLNIGNISTIPNDFAANFTSLKNVAIDSNIKSIGNRAFLGCAKLESLSFLGSCSSIGRKAFKDCISLEEISFGELKITEIQSETFSGCANLTDFYFPQTVKTIGWEAFYGCGNLTTIILPKSIEKIGKNAFANCTGVKHLELSHFSDFINLGQFFDENSLRSIESVKYNDAYQINDYMFRNCHNLENIQLNVSPTKVGKYAFAECRSFEQSDIIPNVLEFGKAAFYNASLREIELNDRLTVIPDLAFARNYLSKIEFPSSITKIGKGAFYANKNLSSLSVPAKVKIIGKEAFMQTNILTVKMPIISTPAKKYLDTGNASTIREVELIAGGKNVMPANYFKDFYKLETVTISAKIHVIGRAAFQNCHNLKYFSLDTNVKTIKSYAFSNCTSLLEVNLPSSVKKVGQGVFFGCSKVETVKINVIGTQSFKNYFSNGDLLHLNKLEIADSTTIPRNYFKNFTNLKEFDFSNYREIKGGAFKNTGLITLDLGGVDEVGKAAFKDCSYLTEVTLDKYMTEIPNRAFMSNQKLRTINNFSQITRVGYNSFNGCSRLNDLDLTGLEYIGGSAFRDCDNLVNIHLENATHIGTMSFYDCQNTESVKVDKLDAAIKFAAFGGESNIREIKMPLTRNLLGNKMIGTIFSPKALKKVEKIHLTGVKSFHRSTLMNFERVKYIEIEGPLTQVGKKALYKKTHLIRIELPDSVRTLKESAFAGCSNLNEINLPAALDRIEKKAFSNCDSISKLTLPSNLSYVGRRAFFGTSISLENANSHSQMFINKWDADWNERELSIGLFGCASSSGTFWFAILIAAIVIGVIKGIKDNI